MRTALLIGALCASAFAWSGFKGIPGDYCRTRRPEQCCQSRDDDCTADILGSHKCYCDMFCHREDEEMHGDCCPDFEEVCLGKPIVKTGPCETGGVKYSIGERTRVNCKTCSCGQHGWERCEPDVKCLVQEELLTQNKESRSSNGLPWVAGNYTQFWGRPLSEGVKYKLGTFYPEEVVQRMHGIIAPEVDRLPDRFDSREKWPGMISEARDQGDCGASWVFSTIRSFGNFVGRHKQGGCEGGYLDRAFWYLQKNGIVTEDCLRYQSGSTSQPGTCEMPKDWRETKPIRFDRCPDSGRESRVYRITPAYRLASKEEDIMAEIMTNGPVQATFKVHEDFFMYQSGVYRKMDGVQPADPRNTYHSVRIIGWGTENVGGRDVKYWLCVNSWGRGWGDNGVFKIVRGENHCEIESFVITALGQGAKKRRRRLMRKMKRQRVLKI